MDALLRLCTFLLTALASVGVVAACATTPAPSPTPASAERTLSPQDKDDIAAALAQAAENTGLTNPPQVDLIRVVPAAEYASTQVACLHDKGFANVSLTADGTGVTVELPGGDQVDAYNVATYTCMAQYPRDPAQDESRMTRDQRLIVYTYVSQTLVECLKNKGYTIGAIPSEESFLATWDSGAWNPYAELGSVDTPDDVLRACPRDTPPELIWGDGAR